MKAKEFLALELFDPELDSSKLTENIANLAKFLSEQQAPFSLETLRPTMSFLLETEDLMATHKVEQQIDLTRAFIYAFSLTAPNFPFDDDLTNILPRLYHLIAQGLPALEEKDEKELTNILNNANEINFFVLPKESTSVTEIFDALSELDAKASLVSIKHLINATDRIPMQIIQEIIEHLSNDKAKDIIKSISTQKQNELLTGIRSIFQGAEAIDATAKVSEILEVAPEELYGSLRGEVISEEKSTREAAIRLFTKTLAHQKITKDTADYFFSIVGRHRDESDEIRKMVIQFCFTILHNLKDFKVPGYKPNSLIETIWNAIQMALTDPSSNVRLAVVKGISKMKLNEIKIDIQEFAKRIQDKDSRVNTKALDILLEFYAKDPEGFKWLEEPAIRLYPTFKTIPLTAFSTFIAHRPLLDIMDGLEDRRNLLRILNDTNIFRGLAPRYKEAEVKEQIEAFVPLKVLKTAVKHSPKFFENALDQKQRSRLRKHLKKSLETEQVYNLLGYYQPIPALPSDVLEWDNTTYAKEYAEVFYSDFEEYIPEMTKRMSSTDIAVFTKMEKAEIKDLPEVLKALVKATTTGDRLEAIEAISVLFKPGNEKILKRIKFAKDEKVEKIKFFARIGVASLVPDDILSEIEDEYEEFDQEQAIWALKLMTTQDPTRCINFHVKVVEKFPCETFDSYLKCASLENTELYYAATEPEIFRKFASIVQAIDPDVRQHCIEQLNIALTNPQTPIQFLCLLALSATDPVKKHVKLAEEYLKKQIQFRRDILKKIKKSSSQVTPVTALPYLIHVLAHHSDFEKDAPKFQSFALYIRAFMKPLTEGTNNYEAIMEVLRHMKYAEDIDEDYTENMCKLVDVSLSVIMDIVGNKIWDQPSQSNDVMLSQRYFKPCEDIDRIKVDLLKMKFDIIKSPAKPKTILNAGMSPVKPTKYKRRGRAVKDKDKEKTKTTDKKKKKKQESSSSSSSSDSSSSSSSSSKSSSSSSSSSTSSSSSNSSSSSSSSSDSESSE